MKEFIFLLLTLTSFAVQAQQAPCDQCADAGACFGSGVCAGCGASADCVGVCEGCATAGPCRHCFEEEEEKEEPWPWPVQVPELGCDYSVDKAEVTLVRGEIPTWLEGTFYHGQNTNSTHEGYDGNLASPSGILAITFDGEKAPVTSFSYAKGQSWQETCAEQADPPAVIDCVVTVNQFGTPGTLASVCAGGTLGAFATDDAGGLNYDGALQFTWQNESLDDTWPYGKECAGFCPANLQPEHMPIDSNGDVYSLYYTLEPSPGYRIFKIPQGSMERVEVSWVKSVRDAPSYTHMGPVPTQSYIVVVEPPLPLDLNYDWAKYQASFDKTAPLNIYVVRKDGGDVIAQYTTEETFWTWHVANAWEDCETGEVILDITRDPNAQSFKSFYNSTPGDFDESSLVRVTLPNPETAGLSAVANTQVLDTAGLSVEFPVTQDQYQFAGKTGHYWMAGAREGTQAFPLSMVALVKHDVASGESSVWEPEGLHMGEPFFIPREKDQGALSDEGAIMVVAMNSTGHLFGAVLDASSMEELALFELPMAPAPAFGLHSYFSTVSSWVSTPEYCSGETVNFEESSGALTARFAVGALVAAFLPVLSTL